MVYVRLAESAAHTCFTVDCESVAEAMALTHYYVWRGSHRRCAEIVSTDIAFPWPCAIAYTRRGSFAEESLTDRAFEYLYDTVL